MNKIYFKRLRPLVAAVVVALMVSAGLLFSAISNRANSKHFSDELLNKVSEKYGPDAAKRLVAPGEMVEASGNLDDQGKIRAVNDFFNRIPYYTDMRHCKKED